MNRPSPRSPGRPAALSLALSLALGLLVAPAAQAIPADLQPAPATPTPPTAPEAPAAPEAPTAAEAAPADIPAGSAFTASLSLRVDDREKALQRAVELTRERGGWFASLQSDRV